MSENEHSRHALLYLFHQKKKAAESNRLLVETYGEHAPNLKACETWFRKFKSGDFDVKDSEPSDRPKKKLLKSCETVNSDRYRQQIINLNHALIEKRPEWARRHSKVILLHDNAPSYTAKSVTAALKSLGWEVLSHPLYFLDLAPSDYQLFASMGYTLAEQHFANFEEVEK